MPHQFLDRGTLALGDLEHELVMHLQQQSRRQACGCNPRCTPSIATLMMSAALPWIGAFSAARSAISRRLRLSLLRSVEIAATAHDRLGVTRSAGVVDHRAQVVAHPAEAGEVGIHLLTRLVRRDLQLLRQAERPTVRTPGRRTSP